MDKGSKRDTTPVNKSAEIIPGPGKYEVLRKTSSAKTVQWSKQISREKLSKKDPYKNLGPGVYTTKPAFGEGPKVVFFVNHKLNSLPYIKKL